MFLVLFFDTGIGQVFTPRLGDKKVLVLLVDFSDLPGSAPSALGASNEMQKVSAFFSSNSFGQLTLAADVVGPLRLSRPSSSYLNESGKQQLRGDALEAARASGHDPNAYDYDIVTFTNIGLRLFANGTINGRGIWMQLLPGQAFVAGTIAHELGHNLGLGHAKAWPSREVLGTRTREDASNVYDTLGFPQFSFSACHFNSNFKSVLGWIPEDALQRVNSSGTFRIYAMDGGGPIVPGRKYALVVPAKATITGTPSDYWVECRCLIDHPSCQSGVILMLGNTVPGADTFLLDTTPGTQAGILDMLDCPITLGRAFADPARKILIRPISCGGTRADRYFDVQVVLDSTTKPPTIVEQPHSRSVPLGSNAVLHVSATSSSPIAYQWLQFGSRIPGATNAALIVDNVQPAHSGDYTVTLSNYLGSLVSLPATLMITSSSTSCCPVPDGLVAWWPGDGNARDRAGSSHGVLVGKASYSQGQVGKAFAFNGTSDFLLAPKSSLWAFGRNDFTIDLWAKFLGLGKSPAFVACDAGPGARNKWIFWLNDGQLRLHMSGTAHANLGTAEFSPILGQWYHLAVSRSGDVFRFFLNGIEVSTVSASIDVPDAKVVLAIGMAEGDNFFHGLLDDVRIYHRGLSAQEILAIYLAGSAGMCSPSGKN